MTGATPPGRVVVVGDVFLDIEIEGRADRRSPDAAVPVVDVVGRAHRPGGAGLAALLTVPESAATVLIGGFADDEPGRRLRALLDGITPYGSAPTIPSRSGTTIDIVALPLTGETVCTERVRAIGPWAGPGGREMLTPITRLDSGAGRVTDGPLPDAVRTALEAADAILVSDHGRGTADHPQLRALLTSHAARTPLVWDPHPRGPDPVPGAALVVLNRAEAERLVPTESGFGDRARELAERWSADAVAITLGAEGAVLHRPGPNEPRHISVPIELRVGFGGDTCGAGERFSGAVATALAMGIDTEWAVLRAVSTAAEFVAGGAAASVAVPQTASDEHFAVHSYGMTTTPARSHPVVEPPPLAPTDPAPTAAATASTEPNRRTGAGLPDPAGTRIG
ncbi:PfkB family carbohydrate kinase [Nocardia paucivorans]|uniref:PfkB family carbohydrate kinase n=1 Tax=Nocardia paucivorans TaxID=114259 RepID=UPI00031C4CB5|nr:PfkB family carbohydrate kinase [Nocardia paucivorans]